MPEQLPTNYRVNKVHLGIYYPGDVVTAEQVGVSLYEHIALEHLIPTQDPPTTVAIAKPLVANERTTLDEVIAKANDIQTKALEIENDRDAKQAQLEANAAELEELKQKLADAEAGKAKAEAEAAEALAATEKSRKRG